jgi:glutathione synthase/RimK-type ligase-like ATP-grasp enzyme
VRPHIFLVDHPSDGVRLGADGEVVPVREYLTDPSWSDRRGLRVVNLCRDLQYHSAGYYASLLAEARGHRVVPSVRTIQDLSRRALYVRDVEDLDPGTRQAVDQLAPEGAETFDFLLVFGEAALPELRRLGRALFGAFPAPILRVTLRRRGEWRVHAVRTIGVSRLQEPEIEFFRSAVGRAMRGGWRGARSTTVARWELAILHDPEEQFAPSDRRALAAFLRAARHEGLAAELITRRDYGRLAEFDALFIRETTNVHHHTYQFSRRAHREGLVVIDDPDSILRCTNKIFLAELLARERVPTPRSVIMAGDELGRAEALGFPLVLKVPDGAFSKGVFKVEDRDELEARARPLFEHSELLLAQEWTYTPFDWRIGVLAGEPLFACKYFMSRGHWQILDHAVRTGDNSGAVESVPIDDVPTEVLAMALRAAGLIGDGLYGVDLKATTDGVKVIEVNDNPNIDGGIEDELLGDELYRRVVREFVRRLEMRSRGPRAASERARSGG